LADVPTNGNTNIVWYDQMVGGNGPLSLSTTLNTGDVYFAAIRIGNGSCVSIQRTEVNFIIENFTPEPPPVESPQFFCEGVLIANIATPNNKIKFYLDATGGVALSPTVKLEERTYYAEQEAGICKSAVRTPVEIKFDGYPAPFVHPIQTICNGKKVYVSDLFVVGAGIKWYDNSGNEITSPETTKLHDGDIFCAVQSNGDCESDKICVTITEDCFSPFGTIFPFVHTGNNIFDAQFITTAKLYIIPPAGIIDKIGYVRKQAPVYETVVSHYDCTTDFIEGTPKNPGTIGGTNNPGLQIHWNNPGVIDNTLLTGLNDCPTVEIGKFEFKNIAPGTYILEIARAGFLPRYKEVTIASDVYLGHREILGGDINGDFIINEKDLSAILSKSSAYGNSGYNWKNDFNGDGQVNTIERNIIRVNLNTSSEIYKETLDWLQ
jgi:hypothetical protein